MWPTIIAAFSCLVAVIGLVYSRSDKQRQPILEAISKLDKKFDKLDEKTEKLSERVTRLETINELQKIK